MRAFWVDKNATPKNWLMWVKGLMSIIGYLLFKTLFIITGMRWGPYCFDSMLSEASPLTWTSILHTVCDIKKFTFRFVKMIVIFSFYK